jgi:hypothetical protein
MPPAISPATKQASACAMSGKGLAKLTFQHPAWYLILHKGRRFQAEASTLDILRNADQRARHTKRKYESEHAFCVWDLVVQGQEILKRHGASPLRTITTSLTPKTRCIRWNRSSNSAFADMPAPY